MKPAKEMTDAEYLAGFSPQPSNFPLYNHDSMAGSYAREDAELTMRQFSGWKVAKEKLRGFDAAFDALYGVDFEELCRFSGYWVDEDSIAGEFLIALRDAYILMITRIVERYPESHKEPRSYPEIEIYNSVKEILEDDEIAQLGFDFGGEDYAEDEVDHVSFTVFEELDELFCDISGWKG